MYFNVSCVVGCQGKRTNKELAVRCRGSKFGSLRQKNMERQTTHKIN